jgi:hypothetical protein
MAQKARRKKQSVLTQSQLVGTKQHDAVTASKVVIDSPAPEPSAKAAVDFREEYHYVLADLGRIGVLAAIMFAILIVLNLILR